MADLRSFKRALEDVKSLFSVDTKQEQEEDLFNFVSKRDVFVNLPTCFGKSLNYQSFNIYIYIYIYIYIDGTVSALWASSM